MKLPKFRSFFNHSNALPLLLVLVFVVIVLSAADYLLYTAQIKKVREGLASKDREIAKIKSEDQYQKNIKLQEEIKNIHDTYAKAVSSYEKITDERQTVKDNSLDKLFAQSLKFLSDKNYTSASATLADIDKQIKDMEAKKLAQISEATVQPAAAQQGAGANTTLTNNNPPASGYSRQRVSASGGTFVVDIIAADLNSTKVIVDTASDSDCKDNCPTMSLGDYASRSGAYAGINGSFFCPAEYPSCAGKTNSFDTLLMNKNKHYFNSDNNVYSVVPAVVFSGNSARFVSRSLEWGRDTGVDAVLANYPLLLLGGNNVFSGSGEEKINNKGTRNFVGVKGSTVYIGIVHNASTAEEAEILKALGLQDALGLDQGGSTALWLGGRYIAGPGRNIPNALLFVKK